ncbi:MAG: hypothetical protein H0Z39_03870 [Peptococcaceae bacterium]|nr:hypothetical protein [Peptococcaceae bacterium]
MNLLGRGGTVDERGPFNLTSREKKLIYFLRQMGWGEVKLRVENGQPVVVYEAIRTVRLEEKPGSNRKDRKGIVIKPLQEVAEICLR